MPKTSSDSRSEEDDDTKTTRQTETDALSFSPPRHSTVAHRAFLILIVFVVVAGAVTFFLRHDQIFDSIRLRGYQAPKEIVDLANQADMTPYAKRLLYVNYPAVEDKQAFNQHCPNASREIAVLGCYLGDRRGIYIYRVTDQRLNGIEQITTAHEMLHQAYDRLNSSDRKRVNKLLEDYAATITDEGLKQKMAAYKDLDPSQIDNERHSVFGTEASNLPAELEEYYKKYFNDRKRVLAYYQQSHQAFTQRQEQIDAYDKQLETLKTQIEQSKAQLAEQEASLDAERVKMDAYLASNQVATYNAAVPGFNARVEQYKQKVNAANGMIDEYNALIEKRNAIAVEQQELIKAQDSRSTSEADAQ